MTHPGFGSPLIADYERAIEKTPLSDAERHERESALDEMKQPSAERHREAYKVAVAQRDGAA